MRYARLDTLNNALLQSDPFPFLVVPDFISREDARVINADYPAIEGAANFDLADLDYGPAFADLVEDLQSADFARALGAHYGLDLAALPSTITVRRFCERTDGNIHTDHRSKIVTVLVYFNETWDRPEGQLRMLRSRHDIEDYVAEVPPLAGTLLSFQRTPRSWHGHNRFVGERRMLQLNYLDRSPLAVAAQRIARGGTHFAKHVLGLR